MPSYSYIHGHANHMKLQLGSVAESMFKKYAIKYHINAII